MRYLLTAIAFIFVVQVAYAKPEPSWMDDAWINFIKQHKELYLEVFPIAKRMDQSSMTTEQAHRLQKVVQGRPVHEQRILYRMMNHIRRIRRFDDPIFGTPSSNDRMEEVVVIGRMFDQFPMDPAEFSFYDTAGMRNIQEQAHELFSEGRFDEAYPLLLDLAKRGFKTSQSRLAYILFTGTEKVEKSNLRALGWLGTAAYGETQPQFRKLFKKYMKEVPTGVRPTVDEVLAGYRAEFDSSAHLNCTTNHRFSSGRVKRTYCQFDIESKVEACQGFDCSSLRTNTDLTLQRMN
ncbi:MAG: hypothetical protein OXG15_06285 [Gammaproteobacteria bacterium]|nr:hypothetical protein [Gammaproteobacteria bacterium]